MKKLTMVVHTTQQQALGDYLRSQQVKTFMFTHIEEHSSQVEQDAFLSARDKVVGYVPQVRVDIITSEEKIKRLLENVWNSDFSFKGKGVYWITEVDEFGVL